MIKFERGKNKIEFGVMKIANRRTKALVKLRGANIDILAYFRNDDCANEFEKMLDYIVELANDE